MITKSVLAIFLSKLKPIEKPKLLPEQYQTDSESAAEILWFAKLKGDIEGKTIADFGAGNGIFGIGALLLGASEVFLVENDKAAAGIAEDNIETIKNEAVKNTGIGEVRVVRGDVKGFNQKVDTVLQNPPFGTKEKHADRAFLLKAFEIADVVYSFHKKSTRSFVEAVARDNDFRITNAFSIEFQIKKTYEFHKKPVKKVEVVCFRMEKNK